MGININEINHTNLIINDKYINYSVLLQLCLPKVLLVPFASNLIRMSKLRCLRWEVNDSIYVHATSQGPIEFIDRMGTVLDKTESQEYR